MSSRISRREAMKTAVAALTLPLPDECGGEELWRSELVEGLRQVGASTKFIKPIVFRGYPIVEYLPPVIVGVKDSTQPNTIEMDWFRS